MRGGAGCGTLPRTDPEEAVRRGDKEMRAAEPILPTPPLLDPSSQESMPLSPSLGSEAGPERLDTWPI